MTLSTALQQPLVHNTFGIKNVTSQNNNSVNEEYILQRIRNMGVTFVGMQEDYSGGWRVPGVENTTHDANGNLVSGVWVRICPVMMQQLIDDPLFREHQFQAIQREMEILNDPRVQERIAAGQPVTFSLAITESSGGLSMRDIDEVVNIILSEDNVYEDAPELVVQEDEETSETHYRLTELLIQKHASQHAAKVAEHLPGNTSISYDNEIPVEKLPPGHTTIGTNGDVINRAIMQVLTIEHGGNSFTAIVTPSGTWIAEEGWENTSQFAKFDVPQGIHGIPQDILLELEAIGKMLQHMPPQSPTNANGVWQSNGVQISQRGRSYENPHGVSDAGENTPAATEAPSEAVFSSTNELLHSGLQQITSAFAAIQQDTATSQAAESAFLHMLRNSPILTAHFARLNIPEGTDPVGLSAEEIQQLHDKARSQLEQFGENFLIKFNQYGLTDGFNVAWARLSNSHF